jgi:hypothetical protein
MRLMVRVSPDLVLPGIARALYEVSRASRGARSRPREQSQREPT